MSLECVVFVAGVIVQVTASTSWVQVMIGRFISGLGVGGLSAAVPMVRSCTVQSSSPLTQLAVPSRNSPTSDSWSHDVSSLASLDSGPTSIIWQCHISVIHNLRDPGRLWV